MKISILTPSFNSGKYIERAINSVLDQQFHDYEHIVIDGGSSDETIQILKKHPHLKWISEPDKGQSDAMNKAFDRSCGEIIGYLNADDWYIEGIFEKVKEYFNSNPDKKLLIGNFLLSEQGSIYHISPEETYEKIIYHYKFNFAFNPVSYFYRREVQTEVGPFPIGNHYTMDYWFLLESFRKFPDSIGKVDDTFGCFFMDGSNKTSQIQAVKECRSTLTSHLLRHKEFYRLFKYWVDYLRFLFRKNRPKLRQLAQDFGKVILQRKTSN